MSIKKNRRTKFAGLCVVGRARPKNSHCSDGVLMAPPHGPQMAADHFYKQSFGKSQLRFLPAALLAYQSRFSYVYLSVFIS
jgi:hypothetical protein